ncbi:hypothetical protein J2129_001019 [Methanofollis sp. W23]|nr:hypothetical protein [Methanofollis sp. W23]MBP2145565.1 hypothetical protein [Methanofollis sp. W23]
MLPLFPTKGMFNIMKARHEIWKQKYPDRKPARDFPLKGIENARPETLAASQIRVDLEKIPFDPREFIRNLPDWENIDVGWGAGEK